jgi:hypothetical protein
MILSGDIALRKASLRLSEEHFPMGNFAPSRVDVLTAQIGMVSRYGPVYC